MIHFFRDVIDGPIYIVTVVISLFGIMAIFGFILEHLKKKEEPVALVKEIESKNGSKLVISSLQLEQEENKNSSLDKNSEDILSLNSNDVIDDGISIDEISDVNKVSNEEEGILSINSSDVVVSEIIEEEETPNLEEETHKVKDMTQVIDFGSTDSVEEEVEKI